jgi:hypothetical protein
MLLQLEGSTMLLAEGLQTWNMVSIICWCCRMGCTRGGLPSQNVPAIRPSGNGSQKNGFSFRLGVGPAGTLAAIGAAGRMRPEQTLPVEPFGRPSEQSAPSAVLAVLVAAMITGKSCHIK